MGKILDLHVVQPCWRKCITWDSLWEFIPLAISSAPSTYCMWTRLLPTIMPSTSIWVLHLKAYAKINYSFHKLLLATVYYHSSNNKIIKTIILPSYFLLKSYAFFCNFVFFPIQILNIISHIGNLTFKQNYQYKMT